MKRSIFVITVIVLMAALLITGCAGNKNVPNVTDSPGMTATYTPGVTATMSPAERHGPGYGQHE